VRKPQLEEGRRSPKALSFVPSFLCWVVYKHTLFTPSQPNTHQASFTYYCRKGSSSLSEWEHMRHWDSHVGREEASCEVTSGTWRLQRPPTMNNDSSVWWLWFSAKGCFLGDACTGCLIRDFAHPCAFVSSKLDSESSDEYKRS
jgi:hypothetical protein